MKGKRFKPISMLLGVLAAFPAAVECQGSWILRGRVLDSETMGPVKGAFVAPANSDRGTLSDSLGMFSLRMNSGPEQSIRISLLGFHDIQAPVDPSRAGQLLTVGLVPDPVQVEGLTVLAARLSDRRRGIYGAGDILDRSQLLNAPDVTGYDLVLRMLPFVELCSLDSAALCLGGRMAMGQKTRVSVCFDGSNVPSEFLEIALSGVDPRALYLVEVYPRAGAVRLYSPGYMKRLIESGRELPPLTFGCAGGR